jgi:hypothetical protein
VRAMRLREAAVLRRLFAKRVYVKCSLHYRSTATPPSTKWTAVVSRDKGPFGSGSTTAGLDAFGCELSSRSLNAAT